MGKILYFTIVGLMKYQNNTSEMACSFTNVNNIYLFSNSKISIKSSVWQPNFHYYLKNINSFLGQDLNTVLQLNMLLCCYTIMIILFQIKIFKLIVYRYYVLNLQRKILT